MSPEAMQMLAYIPPKSTAMAMNINIPSINDIIDQGQRRSLQVCPTNKILPRIVFSSTPIDEDGIAGNIHKVDHIDRIKLIDTILPSILSPSIGLRIEVHDVRQRVNDGCPDNANGVW